MLLYGDPKFLAEFNNNILNSSIDYILSTKRFESAFLTETWFVIELFITFIFQFHRAIFIYLFIFLSSFQFFQVYEQLLYLFFFFGFLCLFLYTIVNIEK